MKSYLEHANITVQNIDDVIHFFKTAFPEFKVRGRGETGTEKWAHIGTDDTYIAINQQVKTSPAKRLLDTEAILNHLGFVVDDVDALSERLTKAGYKKGSVSDSHPYRIRHYFFDNDGNEYEFVQYLSDKPEERNDYSL